MVRVRDLRDGGAVCPRTRLTFPPPDVVLDVVLVKAGRTKIRYGAELLVDDGTRLAVRAPWAGEGVRDFGFVRFEPGDVFTEYYWRDRWYAVKEVRDAPVA